VTANIQGYVNLTCAVSLPGFGNRPTGSAESPDLKFPPPTAGHSSLSLEKLGLTISADPYFGFVNASQQ
jgi:hypothetical protein